MPNDSPGQKVIRVWNRLKGWPGGRWMFSILLGFMVPYSGSISPRVVELGPGRSKIIIKDRRRLRNHLRSVHALALANLGELASGLAMLALLPPTIRGIPTRITTEYLKKARGTLTADCSCVVPVVIEPTSMQVEAHIRDTSSDVVATVKVDWLLDLSE